MSVPYQLEISNDGQTRFYVNVSNIVEDRPDEELEVTFYAVRNDGTPVFTRKINVNEVRGLFSHLKAVTVISEGRPQSAQIVESTDAINLLIEQLDEVEIETIKTLLEKFESDEKIKGLLESLSELEIVNLYGAYHHKRMKDELDALELLIALETESKLKELESYPNLIKYKAGQPEKIFQNWIEGNLWIFGIEHFKLYDSRRIAFYSEADMLMETADGYLDLIELKRPKHTLFRHDKSHNCYHPHPELSAVIGQSLFYLQKLDEFKLNLENAYDAKVVMPRVKVIIGNSNDFDDERNDALRMLNCNLSRIQIVTYSELLNNGRMLISSMEIGTIED